jgi:acyl carrier protein
MKKSKENIKKDIIKFLKKGNPQFNQIKKVPLNKSLVELGFMDSFGVIDAITYLEKKWKIKINDEEITKELFGSINKMTELVFSKIK